jgi:hypothetical protein
MHCYGVWELEHGKRRKGRSIQRLHMRKTHEIKQLPVSSTASGTETHHQFRSLRLWHACDLRDMLLYNTLSALGSRNWTVVPCTGCQAPNFCNGSRRARPECDICKTQHTKVAGYDGRLLPTQTKVASRDWQCLTLSSTPIDRHRTKLTSRALGCGDGACK